MFAIIVPLDSKKFVFVHTHPSQQNYITGKGFVLKPSFGSHRSVKCIIFNRKSSLQSRMPFEGEINSNLKTSTQPESQGQLNSFLFTYPPTPEKMPHIVITMSFRRKSLFTVVNHSRYSKLTQE